MESDSVEEALYFNSQKTEKYEDQQKGAGRWLKNASVNNLLSSIAI